MLQLKNIKSIYNDIEAKQSFKTANLLWWCFLIEPIDKKNHTYWMPVWGYGFWKGKLKKGKVVQIAYEPMHIVVSLIFNGINYRG